MSPNGTTQNWFLLSFLKLISILSLFAFLIDMVKRASSGSGVGLWADISQRIEYATKLVRIYCVDCRDCSLEASAMNVRILEITPVLMSRRKLSMASTTSWF